MTLGVFCWCCGCSPRIVPKIIQDGAPVHHVIDSIPPESQHLRSLPARQRLLNETTKEKSAELARHRDAERQRSKLPPTMVAGQQQTVEGFRRQRVFILSAVFR